MSWIRAFLELNKSLFLKGLLLLMVFLLGLQMGQSRLQRQWDAEKQAVQITQAKQEQHAADVAHVQNQISKEISDDYRKKSSLLSGNAVVSERVLDKSETSAGSLSAISANSAGVASASSDPLSIAQGSPEVKSCAELIYEAQITTLMLVELQKWVRAISESMTEVGVTR
jgi:C4-dicarboxylate-specific signal transduction histidine kinase